MPWMKDRDGVTLFYSSNFWVQPANLPWSSKNRWKWAHERTRSGTRAWQGRALSWTTFFFSMGQENSWKDGDFQWPSSPEQLTHMLQGSCHSRKAIAIGTGSLVASTREWKLHLTVEGHASIFKPLISLWWIWRIQRVRMQTGNWHMVNMCIYIYIYRSSTPVYI